MSRPKIWNLSRLRLAVQTLFLGVTVYGGTIVGPYLADKISKSLPALSCVFDKSNAAYCVLIPLQHQMHHRVGETFARLGELSLSIFIPILFTLLSFYLFFVILNKAFCGWICPLGTVQELLYKLGRYLDLAIHRLTGLQVRRVRPVKWVMLLVLVFLLPLATGLGYVPHAAGDAYCQVCPSRIVTTLLTADTEQLAVSRAGWLDFLFGAIRALLAGMVLVAALTVRQPFCRICPMLAFHALFKRLAILRLVKREHGKCDRCDLCTRACPMDIPEISTSHGHTAFNEDCTLCGRCAEFCPEDGVIQLKFGPASIYRSSRETFLQRSRREKPDGSYKRPLKSAGRGAKDE
ncbi:MAG: 4Fe-4S binding protein [Magnetococcales bacterium]|nr:4Fe-4S binding protein [Magnetococcales bacterium]